MRCDSNSSSGGETNFRGGGVEDVRDAAGNSANPLLQRGRHQRSLSHSLIHEAQQRDAKTDYLSHARSAAAPP